MLTHTTTQQETVTRRPAKAQQGESEADPGGRAHEADVAPATPRHVLTGAPLLPLLAQPLPTSPSNLLLSPTRSVPKGTHVSLSLEGTGLYACLLLTPTHTLPGAALPRPPRDLLALLPPN